MFGIRKEILKAVDPSIKLGDTFRLVHEEQVDGTPCSKGKDAALAVTREKTGWVYYCHRCQEQGFIADEKKSPMEVTSMIEKLKKQQTYKAFQKITLPHDFIPMCKEYDAQVCDYKNNDIIPWAAYNWLWQYSITGKELNQFNIGWSNGYQRVILPIYDYGFYNGDTTRKLIGWVGREVECKTKEERKEKKIAKYLICKDRTTKRIYWYIPPIKLRDHLIIVEDIVSAIKIHKATGMMVLALLNTHIGNDLLMKSQGKKVHIWLDGDMLAKSVGYTTRFRQFGIEANHIHTPKDPKAYNEAFIASQISRET